MPKRTKLRWSGKLHPILLLLCSFCESFNNEIVDWMTGWFTFFQTNNIPFCSYFHTKRHSSCPLQSFLAQTSWSCDNSWWRDSCSTSVHHCHVYTLFQHLYNTSASMCHNSNYTSLTSCHLLISATSLTVQLRWLWQAEVLSPWPCRL